MNEYAVEGDYDLVIPPTRSLLGANERAGDSLMLETGVQEEGTSENAFQEGKLCHLIL